MADQRHCGTRAQYQRGCACLPCRSAEAAYRADLRLRQAKGSPIFGQYVSGREAARRIKALLLERYTRRQIAERAGLERQTLRVTPKQQIRLKTLLKLRRVTRLLLGESVDDARENDLL